MFARNFQNKIEEVLTSSFNQEIKVLGISAVGGGSINDAFRLDTNRGYFFMKTNRAERYPLMFEREKEGLELLRDAKCITIPEVIGVGSFENTSYLLLEHIKSVAKTSGFWESFGQQLAQLHQTTSDNFGLEQDNYIGSLNGQTNNAHTSWTEFYTEERLMQQVKLAQLNNQVDSQTINQFEMLYKRLPDLFPEEVPSLLHGDLWSGNFMAGNKGEPVVMDPAVYFGHREMDLAMTKLFGGFDEELYHAYDEVFPLENEWEERVDLWNLYPLMVHVNLFGGGYLGQVKSILNKFGS